MSLGYESSNSAQINGKNRNLPKTGKTMIKVMHNAITAEPHLALSEPSSSATIIELNLVLEATSQIFSFVLYLTWRQLIRARSGLFLLFFILFYIS